MFSSIRQDWRTPDDVFAELDAEFHFTMDPCPASGPDFDGLLIPWSGSVFVNPPFGRELPKWIKKAWDEADNGTTVVLLIPSRTDTRWFHDYVARAQLEGHGEIRFIRGRLRFKNPNKEEWDSQSCAPFPSMVVVFHGKTPLH